MDSAELVFSDSDRLTERFYDNCRPYRGCWSRCAGVVPFQAARIAQLDPKRRENVSLVTEGRRF